MMGSRGTHFDPLRGYAGIMFGCIMYGYEQGVAGGPWYDFNVATGGVELVATTLRKFRIRF